MKKKISLLLCMLASILCLTACGGNNKDSLENYDKDTVDQMTEFMINYCDSADEATIEQWKNAEEFDVQSQLYTAGLPISPESFVGALESWKAGVEECGTFEGCSEPTYEVSHGDLKVMVEANYSDRDATITFIYNEKSRLESMTVDAKFSTAEILKKAGLNTILGMGTVFAVLIFISLIISCFKYIPNILDAFSKKPEKKQEQKAAEVKEAPKAAKKAPVSAAPAAAMNDAELIAVIAAAIAASEGTTTDGFVVRSIRRRPSNKWKAN